MATMATTMQTRITAGGIELTKTSEAIGYGYFECHPIIRALCPPWLFAFLD
jgi:hypothetical protein